MAGANLTTLVQRTDESCCQEKADKAKVLKGYYSDPSRKFMQAGANIRAVLRRIEC